MDHQLVVKGAEERAGMASSCKMRRIENLSNRQVTFTKRRTGLLKKAYELSMLCDAQVAVIVFSSTGKLSEFASPSMPMVLERYKQSLGKTSTNAHLSQNVEYWQGEAMYLKNQIEYVQLQQSFLSGENITSHCLEELDMLEEKLCTTINRVKEKKVELIQSYAQEMQKKELFLREENNLLKLQIAEVGSERERRHSTESTALRLRPFPHKYVCNNSIVSCCIGPGCKKQCGMANFLQLGYEEERSELNGEKVSKRSVWRRVSLSKCCEWG